MITFIRLAPVLFSPLILYFFSAMGILPNWFQADVSDILIIKSISIALILFIFFYLYEYSFNYKSLTDGRLFFQYLVLCIFYELIFDFYNIDVDLRIIAQSLGLNLVYSTIGIFILVVIGFCSKVNIFSSIQFHLLASISALSGSKGTIIAFVLLYILLSRMHIIKLVFIILTITFSLFFIFPSHYLVRYLDPGISMLNMVQVCHDSGMPVFYYYIDVIMQYISGNGAFNPVIEYYKDYGKTPPGYNVTPTVVGDIACGNIYESILLLFCIIVFVWSSMRISSLLFGYNSNINKVHFFIFISVFNSNVFDILKFDVLFWFSILIYRILFLLINILKQVLKPID
jgi:hypothetical protein